MGKSAKNFELTVSVALSALPLDTKGLWYEMRSHFEQINAPRHLTRHVAALVPDATVATLARRYSGAVPRMLEQLRVAGLIDRPALRDGGWMLPDVEGLLYHRARGIQAKDKKKEAEKIASDNEGARLRDDGAQGCALKHAKIIEKIDVKRNVAPNTPPSPFPSPPSPFSPPATPSISPSFPSPSPTHPPVGGGCADESLSSKPPQIRWWTQNRGLAGFPGLHHTPRLNFPEFETALVEWEAYKLENNERFGPMQARALITELDGVAKVFGLAFAISKLAEARARGWKGIRVAEPGKNGQPAPRRQVKSEVFNAG